MNKRTNHEQAFVSFLCERIEMNNNQMNATITLVDKVKKDLNVQQIKQLIAYKSHQTESAIVSVS